MLFLIDYENMSYSGLKGVELLTPQDNLTIFYSQSSKKIEREAFQKIVATNCSFDIQKLQAPGKNALDFLIISHIHTLFTNGGNDPILIISKDKGFQIVRQYWEARGKRIYIQPSVCAAIIAANQQDERCWAAHQVAEKVDLEHEFMLHKRRQYERERLTELVGGNTDKVDSLILYLSSNPAPKEKYLHMLKTFGRTTGLSIYRQIKLFGTETSVAS